MPSRAVVFPFDQFGHAGTGAGALLLGDVLREAVADADEETEPVRPQAYTGDLEIIEFDFATVKELTNWRATGRAAARDGLKSGDFTLWLAGNHLGVLPVYDELGANDLVVQLDAHLDCYDLAGTLDTLSHGNFLRDIKSPRPQIVVLGHRDLFLPPGRVAKWIDAAVPAAECHQDWPGVLDAVRAPRPVVAPGLARPGRGRARPGVRPGGPLAATLRADARAVVGRRGRDRH